VEERSRVTVPAYSGTLEMQFAEVHEK
jgi:hypothetical protein